MKKYISLLLVAAVLLCACACGNTTNDSAAATEASSAAASVAEASEEVGMPNPVHEASDAEMTRTERYCLYAPKGATDVAFATIDGADGAGEIEQVTFTLDGNKYCYRAQSSSCTALFGDVPEETSLSETAAPNYDSAVEIATALCGVYESWKLVDATNVSRSDAVLALNEGEAGFISWLDPIPGILYSLSIDANSSVDLLQQTAEAVYEPLQNNS